MTAFQLTDRAELSGGMREDAAGNLICMARVARTGIYEYAGYELGKPEVPRIRVYRPAEEVFKRDAMHSLAGVPVTVEHPRVLVDTQNWKEFAKGETSDDDIVRDGETIKVPFLLRDADAIRAVRDGKHELSPGYTAVIDWTAGTTDQGEAYDAVQRDIRINHIAIVDKARGGSSCRIGDSEPGEVEVKTILVDGFSVEVTDAAERAIQTLLEARTTLTTERDELRTKLADSEKVKGEAEGKVAVLETQLKDATAPDALSRAAAARAKLCDQAKRISPKLKTDDLTDAEIRRAVVVDKLGDTAKDFSEDKIFGAFDTLALTVKDSADKGSDKLRNALRDTSLDDSDGSLDDLRAKRDKARQNMMDGLRTAHAGRSGEQE